MVLEAKAEGATDKNGKNLYYKLLEKSWKKSKELTEIKEKYKDLKNSLESGNVWEFFQERILIQNSEIENLKKIIRL